MPPLTIVAIATVTDVGMTGVISRTLRRLADLRLATAAEMVKEIAVGMMGATEEIAVAVGETTRRDREEPGAGW